MEYYKIILDQLGGYRFIAMTGAKNFVYDQKNSNMSFSIMRNSKKVTHVTVTLTVMDVYTMEFFNCRGAEIKTIAKVENVYDDMLQDIFTRETGLYTHL